MTAIRAIGILLASLALIGVAEAQKGGGKVKYTVTATVSGSGTVTSNTGGISCPGTCSTTVNSGTNVSLTAIPESGAAFLGWDGDCAIYASDPICTLTVSANTNATANFDNGNNPPTPYSPVVIDVACDGTGTKLQDALNALNPVANVYEVRVSGVCPEPLTIRDYNSLRIAVIQGGIGGAIGSINASRIGRLQVDGIRLGANFICVICNDVRIASASFYCGQSACDSTIAVTGGNYFSMAQTSLSEIDSAVLDIAMQEFTVGLQSGCPSTLYVNTAGSGSIAVDNCVSTVVPTVEANGIVTMKLGPMPIGQALSRWNGRLNLVRDENLQNAVWVEDVQCLYGGNVFIGYPPFIGPDSICN